MKAILNKEKAIEIKKEFEQYGCECVPNDCYDAALKMAQWKDEQFAKEKQQLIDEACNWLKDNIHDYYVTCEFEQWFDDMFDDFKNAMKGE